MCYHTWGVVGRMWHGLQIVPESRLGKELTEPFRVHVQRNCNVHLIKAYTHVVYSKIVREFIDIVLCVRVITTKGTSLEGNMEFNTVKRSQWTQTTPPYGRTRTSVVHGEGVVSTCAEVTAEHAQWYQVDQQLLRSSTQPLTWVA